MDVDLASLSRLFDQKNARKQEKRRNSKNTKIVDVGKHGGLPVDGAGEQGVSLVKRSAAARSPQRGCRTVQHCGHARIRGIQMRRQAALMKLSAPRQHSGDEGYPHAAANVARYVDPSRIA